MEDPELTISDFKDFVKQYPALLFPAYLVQEKIRVGILGTDFWKDLADRRLKLSGNKYISVSAFLAKVIINCSCYVFSHIISLYNE